MTAPPKPDRGRSIGFTLVVAAFLLVVVAGPNLQEFELVRLETVVPLAIGVLSMNLLTGISGQISLGQAAFFGTGAYVTGVLVNDHGWTYLTGGAAGVAAAALLGLLVGLPAIRLRGLYVAITTLGLGLAFPSVLQKMQSTTGGSGGLGMNFPSYPPEWLGVDLTEWTLYVSLAVLALAMLIVWNVRRSPTGRALIAVRDHELVAESFGIRLASAKLFAFTLSAALAGLGGDLYLIQQQFISPTSFSLNQSISFFVGMAIGGQVSVVGGVLGGAFLVYAPVASTSLGVSATLTPLVYGVFLLFFMYFMRDGIVGACASAWRHLVARIGGRTGPRDGVDPQPPSPSAKEPPLGAHPAPR